MLMLLKLFDKSKNLCKVHIPYCRMMNMSSVSLIHSLGWVGAIDWMLFPDYA